MFTLDFDISPAPFKIDIKDKIFLIGSCFSDNTGHKLSAHKFQSVSNPFGTVYNPHSMFKLLGGDLDQDHTTEQNEIFYHWDMHGQICATSADVLKRKIKATLATTKAALKQSSYLIITFGTSHVYKLESGEIVANCHKTPQKKFTKSLLTPSEIIEGYSHCLSELRRDNPNLKVILTVSPVRHVRDGLHENNISKGILHHAVHEIVQQDEKSYYFPSYEIVIDQLRDYRFYEKDMIHPNQQAVDFIWDQFTTSCMEQKTIEFIEGWDKILNAMNHRSFHPETTAHQNFLKKLIEQISQYQDKVDITPELSKIKAQLV